MEEWDHGWEEESVTLDLFRWDELGGVCVITIVETCFSVSRKKCCVNNRSTFSVVVSFSTDLHDSLIIHEQRWKGMSDDA